MNSEEQLRGGVKTPPRTILILGVDNLLPADDGFGVMSIFINSHFPFARRIAMMIEMVHHDI